MMKWSLNSKVIFILSIFTAACILISIIGLTNMNAMSNNLANIVNVSVKRVIYLKDLSGLLRSNIINEKNYALERDPEKMRAIRKDMEDNKATFLEILSTFSSIASEFGKGKVQLINNKYADWWEITTQVQKLVSDRNYAEAVALSNGKARETRLILEGIFRDVVDFNAKFMENEVLKANDAYIRSRNLMIMISLVSIFSGLLLAYFVLSAASRAINQVIASLDDSSNQVTSAAQQIAASAEQLSQASTEQAASLQETVSSVDQLNSMVQKNADNATKSSGLSTTSQESATKGKQVVEEMIKAIDGISTSNQNIMNQINESNEKISDIVKVIGEIGNKTKIINDIVFQTKLLSFNASVEAARAGDHGKGFAVVAEEVGNLAQMSGNAAKEITLMLDESIQKVEGIVNETKSKVELLITDGKGKVENGIHIAQQCGEVLSEIVSNISSVRQMVSEISSACQEQAQGTQEISKAMIQLDQVTQENSATSEQSAGAAEELSSQAESLRNIIQLLIEAIRGQQNQNLVNSAVRLSVHQESPKPHPTHSSKVPGTKKQESSHSSENGQWKGLKGALGLEPQGIPSKNDPRFQDV